MDSKITFSSEKNTFVVGSCEIKVPKHSLKAEEKVEAIISLSNSTGSELALPNGYVPASSTLTFTPFVRFRDHVVLKIPTWFEPKDSTDVDIAIFEKVDHSWNEIDTLPLSDERFIKVKVKTLNNFTAFLLKKSLPDVQISLKSYMFQKESYVKAYVKLDDEVLDLQLKSAMLNTGYEVIEEKAEKQTYGGKVPYLTAQGQHLTNFDDGGSELFVKIDESFLDPKATPMRKLTEKESNNVEETCPKQSMDSTQKCHEFHSDVDADIFVGGVNQLVVGQSDTSSQQTERSSTDKRVDAADGVEMNRNYDVSFPCKFFSKVRFGTVIANANKINIAQDDVPSSSCRVVDSKLKDCSDDA